MKSRHSTILLATALGLGTLYAQPGQAPEGNAPPSEIPAGADMTVAQMATRSEEIAKHAKGDFRHVMHLQQIARKQQDIIKLTCINDKLVQMKPIANALDRDRGKLDLLLADESDERHAAFAQVEESFQELRRLRDEANICAGEAEIAGASENLVEAPDFPIDPTIGDPFDPGIEAPGYASPFQ